MTNENIITYEKELGINGARSFVSPTRRTLQGWLIGIPDKSTDSFLRCLKI